MDLKEYQEKVKEFAVYPGANSGSFPEMNYLVLGLTSEAGEVAGKLKKLVRDGTLDEQAYLHEVGDVLWYLSMICNCIGVSIEEVAEMNYLKLSERKRSGTIKGSGDVRIITPPSGIIVPESVVTPIRPNVQYGEKSRTERGSCETQGNDSGVRGCDEQTSCYSQTTGTE